MGKTVTTRTYYDDYSCREPQSDAEKELISKFQASANAEMIRGKKEGRENTWWLLGGVGAAIGISFLIPSNNY
jgi:hypothetical protein